MKFGSSPNADLIACIVLSLFAAFIIGAGDLPRSQPSGTLIVVVTAGALLGFVFPRYVIVVATILGLAVPTAHVLARLNHWTVEGAPESMWWTLLALIPAIIAALVGGATRRLIAAR